jgi:Raf kinase inhibitor-like YbhB/YbcL family protein
MRMAFQLTSQAFKEGGLIPKQYTCEGADLSPALRWTDPPRGTRSFALIADDPDAPVGTWVHWVLFNLPESQRDLQEGIPPQETLANGARQGLNDFKRVGYGGPCPPPGAPHRYYFKLYALDTVLDLKPRAPKAKVLEACKGHILAEGQVMGRFGR